MLNAHKEIILDNTTINVLAPICLRKLKADIFTKENMSKNQILAIVAIEVRSIRLAINIDNTHKIITQRYESLSTFLEKYWGKSLLIAKLYHNRAFQYIVALIADRVASIAAIHTHLNHQSHNAGFAASAKA